LPIFATRLRTTSRKLATPLALTISGKRSNDEPILSPKSKNN